jgi:hypothetical protein
MTTLSDVFENIAFIPTERRTFFYLWLYDHYGFVDEASILAYIGKLDKEKARDEVKTVKDEYLWCQKEPIERIRRICAK